MYKFLFDTRVQIEQVGVLKTELRFSTILITINKISMVILYKVGVSADIQLILIMSLSLINIFDFVYFTMQHPFVSFFKALSLAA